VREAIAMSDVIRQHDVKLVLRPDSITADLRTPSAVVLWTLAEFARRGLLVPDGHGRMALPAHYGLLWGDGLTTDGITTILRDVTAEGYSATSLVFGMGGGRLQAVTRDTLKTAIKCSAQERNGAWVDVYKETYGKQSLRG